MYEVLSYKIRMLRGFVCTREKEPDTKNKCTEKNFGRKNFEFFSKSLGAHLDV